MVKVEDRIQKLHYFIEHFFLTNYNFESIDEVIDMFTQHIFKTHNNKILKFIDLHKFNYIIKDHLQSTINIIFEKLCDYLETFDYIYSDDDDYTENVCKHSIDPIEDDTISEIFRTEYNKFLEIFDLYECYEANEIYVSYIYSELFRMSK